MLINKWGVFFRSNFLKIPFGDQALCMNKSVFEFLGKFNEETSSGEDHLLIWKAHQNGIKLICTEEYVTTSSRKYSENGWGKTTFKHLVMTYSQAAPEFFKLINTLYKR
jgi:hypothetical protein